jgi:hypothetical protein
MGSAAATAAAAAAAAATAADAVAGWLPDGTVWAILQDRQQQQLQLRRYGRDGSR